MDGFIFVATNFRGLHKNDTLIGFKIHGFIFVGTNFRGLHKNDTLVRFKIHGHSIFFHNSYRKLPFRGYWNSWIGHSMKNTKIDIPRNLSHPQ